MCDTLNCFQQLPLWNTAFTNWGTYGNVMCLVTFMFIKFQYRSISDIIILGWAEAETLGLQIHVWWILYHYEVCIKSKATSCNVMDFINTDLDKLPSSMEGSVVTVQWLLVWKCHINDTVWLYRFCWIASVVLHIFLRS